MILRNSVILLQTDFLLTLLFVLLFILFQISIAYRREIEGNERLLEFSTHQKNKSEGLIFISLCFVSLYFQYTYHIHSFTTFLQTALLF